MEISVRKEKFRRLKESVVNICFLFFQRELEVSFKISFKSSMLANRGADSLAYVKDKISKGPPACYF